MFLQTFGDVTVLGERRLVESFALPVENKSLAEAFSCLTVAFTRFLISYVAMVRTRARRLSLVADEVLEQYEGPGQGRTELPEELKAKIQAIRTRFKSAPERGAFKFLINYFLLEGISCQPRKLVLGTLGRQFGFSIDKADALFDYALVCLRSVLHEFYTPVYSAEEILRLCRRSTVLAEIHQLVGGKCFAEPMDVFAGITVTFPSKSALEKMRKSQAFLNGLSDETRAFSPSSLGASAEDQLLSAVLEGIIPRCSCTLPRKLKADRARREIEELRPAGQSDPGQSGACGDQLARKSRNSRLWSCPLFDIPDHARLFSLLHLWWEVSVRLRRHLERAETDDVGGEN
jgi:hypothetical protein